MVPQAKASVAQSEMRHAALRMGGLPVVEDIAHSAHGSNQRLLTRCVNLAAQPVYMDVNHIGVRLNAHSPDFIEDHGTGNNPAGISAQILEEHEFLLGKLQDLTAARGLAP
jgi:hypothetical protein